MSQKISCGVWALGIVRQSKTTGDDCEADKDIIYVTRPKVNQDLDCLKVQILVSLVEKQALYLLPLLALSNADVDW